MLIQQQKAQGRREGSGQLMYIAHQYKALRKSCLGEADRTSTFFIGFFQRKTPHFYGRSTRVQKTNPLRKLLSHKKRNNNNNNKNTKRLTRFSNKNTALSPLAQTSKTAFSTTTALLLNCRKPCDTHAAITKYKHPN